MSAQFGLDAVTVAADVTLATAGTETAVVTGNALTPPYNSFKARINACLQLTIGTGTTSITIRIRRNPSAENVVVATSPNITVTAGNIVSVNFSGTDSPGDGRSVAYQVSVAQNAASATGLAKAGSYLEAGLLSG